MTDEAPKKNKGGGRQPGAGRPKALRNTFTEVEKRKALARGLSPLEVMADLMNHSYRRWKAESNKAEPDQEALMAKQKATLESATAIAPYIHPKLAAVQHTGKGGCPIQPLDFTKFGNDDLDRLEATLGTVTLAFRSNSCSMALRSSAVFEYPRASHDHSRHHAAHHRLRSDS